MKAQRKAEYHYDWFLAVALAYLRQQHPLWVWQVSIETDKTVAVWRLVLRDATGAIVNSFSFPPVVLEAIKGLDYRAFGWFATICADRAIAESLGYE